MKHNMTKPTGLILTAALAVILVGCGQQSGNTAAGTSSHTELKGNGTNNGAETESSQTVQDGITVTKASPTDYVATPYDVRIVGKSSKKSSTGALATIVTRHRSSRASTVFICPVVRAITTLTFRRHRHFKEIRQSR